MFENYKTLSFGEKKALGRRIKWLVWTGSPYFSTAVKKCTALCENACAMSCCGWIRLVFVLSHFPIYTIKKIFVLIIPRAIYLRKIQHV